MNRIAWYLLFVPLAVAAADDDFLAALKSKHADYRWSDKNYLRLDLNRDGASDKVALGLQRRKVALAIEITGAKEAIFFEIPIDSRKEFGLCPGGEPTISKVLQSEVTVEALDETPPGYEICPTCFELEISGGPCDPIYFYWDTKANRLTWWRL